MNALGVVISSFKYVFKVKFSKSQLVIYEFEKHNLRVFLYVYLIVNRILLNDFSRLGVLVLLIEILNDIGYNILYIILTCE